MSETKLIWDIKRAAVNFDDIEDEDTKQKISDAIGLCQANKHEDALKLLPTIDFEFDADNMDDDASGYFLETNYSFSLERGDPNHVIRVGVEGGQLILTIKVIFEVELVDDVDLIQFDEWLSENGGWYAGSATGSWTYTSDDGGGIRVLDEA